MVILHRSYFNVRSNLLHSEIHTAVEELAEFENLTSLCLCRLFASRRISGTFGDGGAVCEASGGIFEGEA